MLVHLRANANAKRTHRSTIHYHVLKCNNKCLCIASVCVYNGEMCVMLNYSLAPHPFMNSPHFYVFVWEYLQCNSSNKPFFLRNAFLPHNTCANITAANYKTYACSLTHSVSQWRQRSPRCHHQLLFITALNECASQKSSQPCGLRPAQSSHLPGSRSEATAAATVPAIMSTRRAVNCACAGAAATTTACGCAAVACFVQRCHRIGR